MLIQEKLAVLLSDTFFVPGYFHFLTVGAVSLTFIATLIYVIPALTEHRCWRPNILSKLPYVLTMGLSLFGAGGIFAGYHGVPIGIVFVVWSMLALMYATIPMIQMPTSFRVWGLGAVVFLGLTILTMVGRFHTPKKQANKISLSDHGYCTIIFMTDEI